MPETKPLISKLKASVLVRFIKNKEGAIAIISAPYLLLAIICAALAVDMGALYLERREAQSAVDLAAMAAAGDLDRAEAAAKATLRANGIKNISSLSVVLGTYKPDTNIKHTERYKAGETPYNAVRVSLNKPGQSYFAGAFTRSCCNIGVTATAAAASQATFSVGSRLLAVRGGVANALLGGLTGSNVSMSVMDYEALIDTNVQILDFMNALSSEIDITGGTYNDILNSSVTVGDIVAAAVKITEESGDTSVNAALNNLLSQLAGTSKTVPLASLIDLGPYGHLAIGDPAPGLDAKFNIMELVSGSAVLANGNHQVEIDLGANIPGVLSLKLRIAIGEPPQHSSWAAVGQPGSVVRTAQTRLSLIADVGGDGVLQGAIIRLPLYLDLAYAEGRLADVSCSNNGSGSAEVATRPGIAELWVGEVGGHAFGDFSSKPKVRVAEIVNTPVAKVLGKAHIDVGNMDETILTFTQSDVDDGTIQRTDTRNIFESLVSSLLKDLKLKVKVSGLGIALPGAVGKLVANSLGKVAKPLDKVVHGLLTTLGVHVGEADVKVHGIRCGSGVLAS